MARSDLLVSLVRAGAAGDRKEVATAVEAIIGSFLGETASRLRRVFDYARTTPCVLFNASVRDSIACGQCWPPTRAGFRCATIRPASRPNARSSSRSRDRFQAEGQVAKQVSAAEFQAKCLRIIKEMRRPVFQDRSNGPRGRQAHSVQRSEGDLQVRGGFRRMRIGAGRPSSPLLAGCAAHTASSASSSDMRRISMSGSRSENARKPNRP